MPSDIEVFVNRKWLLWQIRPAQGISLHRSFNVDGTTCHVRIAESPILSKNPIPRPRPLSEILRFSASKEYPRSVGKGGWPWLNKGFGNKDTYTAFTRLSLPQLTRMTLNEWLTYNEHHSLDLTEHILQIPELYQLHSTVLWRWMDSVENININKGKSQLPN